ITRSGEDIEYSIRGHKAGFKIGLIPEAKVYHKRRTDFLQFYKQVHFFGRARINIYKFFPNELKLVHFFPSVFTLGLIFTLLANLLGWPIAKVGNFVVAVIILLIFFHSWSKNKSAKIAFLSIATSFIQLTGYGLGFMQDFWKRVIFKQS
ncbi:MAG: glycosyltransferase, partial [Sphingobacteriaceae bacterium]